MIEDALYSLLSGTAALTALVGARIMPTELTQDAAFPALVYQRISGVRDHGLSGATGLVESRFQLDAYAEPSATSSGYRTAVSVIDAARAGVSAYRGTVAGTLIHGIFIDSQRDGRVDGADGARRLFRCSLDITIHHMET